MTLGLIGVSLEGLGLHCFPFNTCDVCDAFGEAPGLGPPGAVAASAGCAHSFDI